MAVDPIKQWYAKRERDLIANLKKNYKRPRANFVASELSACRLATWFRLMGYIPCARNPRGEDYGNDGNLHHDSVRNQMREGGMEIGDVTFNKDGTVEETGVYILNITHKGIKFNISMRLDGTLRLGVLKHTLEIKSLGYWKYKPIQKVWEDTESEAAVLGWLMKNRVDMIYQVHANMVATKLKQSYLVFKDRSDCAIGLHSSKNPKAITGGVVVPFSPTLWKGVLDKLAFIQRHIDSGVQPDPDFLEEVTACKYCNYHHLCHGAEKRRKKKLEPAIWHPQLGAKIHLDDNK